ncbi:hypothetical protein [Providencia rustigianii]|uniref:hypothetical protein n=1 Tax=Providencia rustigianii TaxID=158850 RepID=UPI0038B2EE0C
MLEIQMGELDLLETYSSLFMLVSELKLDSLNSIHFRHSLACIFSQKTNKKTHQK